MRIEEYETVSFVGLGKYDIIKALQPMLLANGIKINYHNTDFMFNESTESIQLIVTKEKKETD